MDADHSFQSVIPSRHGDVQAAQRRPANLLQRVSTAGCPHRKCDVSGPARIDYAAEALPKRAAALTFLTQQGKYTFPVALLNVETGTFGQVNYGNMVASAVIAWSPA
jgi:hypothetical protein